MRPAGLGFLRQRGRGKGLAAPWAPLARATRGSSGREPNGKDNKFSGLTMFPWEGGGGPPLHPVGRSPQDLGPQRGVIPLPLHGPETPTACLTSCLLCPPPPTTLSSREQPPAPLTWATLNFSRRLSMVGVWPRSSQGESLRPEGGRLWKLCTTQVTCDRGRGHAEA